MNLDKLLMLAQRLLKIEDANQVQARLEEVQTDLNNISSNPSESSFQSGLVEHLRGLRSSIKLVVKEFTPVEQEIIDEIVNGPEFSTDLYAKVKQAVDQNGLTPSVARDEVVGIVNLRSSTLEKLRNIIDVSEFFGWEADESKTADAIVEFTVPRKIFENQFSGLVRELDFLKKFVALIAEAADESADAELVSLSTTDPIIALGVAYGVAHTLGLTVNWGLGVWKQIEEIRLLRAQTKKIAIHSDAEIRGFFDEKISSTIDSAVSSEAKRLTENISNRNRASEIESGLEIFLKPFLARMERGLTVDIKLIDKPDPNELEAEKIKIFSNLAAQLVFPAAAEDPILALAAPEAVKVSRRRSRAKPRETDSVAATQVDVAPQS